MALEIKGAPAPGWYLPVGLGASDRSAYLWTGLVQLHGKYIRGFVIELVMHDKRPSLRSEWRSPELVRGLSRVPAAYERVEPLPGTWRGQNIREATKECEAEVENYRALLERLEQENTAR